MARKEGTLQQRGPGKFLLRVFLRTEIADVKYRGAVRTKPVNRYHSETFHGEKPAAKVRLRELLAMRDRGELGKVEGVEAPPAPPETLGAFLDTWLALKRTQVRAATWEGYERDLRTRVRPLLGDRAVSSITKADVRELYLKLATTPSKTGRPFSPQSIRMVHTLLGAVMRDAVDLGKIGADPTHRAKLPRLVRREIRTLAPQDLPKILAHLEAWAVPILLLAAGTGMRPCEYTALRWSDVDGDVVNVSRSISWPKGRFLFDDTKTANGRRSIPIGPVPIAALAKHRKVQAEARLKRAHEWQDLGLIFCNEIGLPLRENRIRRAFYAACDQAGVPRLWLNEAGRHTRATEGSRQRLLKEVSGLLGHHSAEFTASTYAQGSTEADRVAVAAMDARTFGHLPK